MSLARPFRSFLPAQARRTPGQVGEEDLALVTRPSCRDNGTTSSPRLRQSRFAPWILARLGRGAPVSTSITALLRSSPKSPDGPLARPSWVNVVIGNEDEVALCRARVASAGRGPCSRRPVLGLAARRRGRNSMPSRSRSRSSPPITGRWAAPSARRGFASGFLARSSRTALEDCLRYCNRRPRSWSAA